MSIGAWTDRHTGGSDLEAVVSRRSGTSTSYWLPVFTE